MIDATVISCKQLQLIKKIINNNEINKKHFKLTTKEADKELDVNLLLLNKNTIEIDSNLTSQRHLHVRKRLITFWKNWKKRKKKTKKEDQDCPI